MASPSRLGGIPVEVMEGIVNLLELCDVRSLRLTSAEIATKSSQGMFETLFRSKKIDLTSSEQLEEFVAMTQPIQFGCLVEHLTLASFPVSNDQEAEDQDSAKLLGQAMNNLRLNSARGCLRSLSLLIEIEDPGHSPWRSIWEAAAKCPQSTALALGASKLPIEELDIFGRVSCCSLACDQIVAVLERVDLTASLREVKKLSMSLSHHQVQDPESEEMMSLITGERNSNAIGQFLELCPKLEDLQLHWYKLYASHLTDALSEEQRFFDHVAATCRLTSLKRCTLKGIYTSEAALLSFLGQVPLSSLEMEEVHLHSGKFQPIFNFLAKHMEHLEHVHVHDLWEDRLLSFDAPGDPRFPTSGSSSGPNILTRIGVDVRIEIETRVNQGYTRVSSVTAHCFRQKFLLYGPPREPNEPWGRDISVQHCFTPRLSRAPMVGHSMYYR